MNLKLSSITSHIDDFRALSDLVGVKFDIFCISKSGITEKLPAIINFNLAGYNIKNNSTYTSSAGRTLMYVSQKIYYKIRLDHKVYSIKELELTIVETSISNKASYTVKII